MEQFCGSELWNSNVTWNTQDPDFTECFQKSFLVWIPCVFLMLFAPLEVYLSCSQTRRSLPVTYLNLSKWAVNLLLILISFVDMIFHLLLYLKDTDVYPIDFFTPFIKCLSLILAFILITLAKKKGHQTSGVLFVFWLLLTLAEVLTFQSILRNVFNQFSSYRKFDNELGMVLKTFYFALTLSELLFAFFSDFVNSSYTKKNFPEPHAAFMSKLTFWWSNPLIFLGYKKPLVIEDMWKLSSKDQSKNIAFQFSPHWLQTLKEAALTEAKKVSILKPLLKTFYPNLIFCSLLKLISSVLTFGNPLLLSLLINFVSSDEPVWRGYLYALSMFLLSMLNCFFNNQYEYWIQIVAMRIKTSFISSIYEKSLNLSNSSKSKFTIGEIVNLMSIDAIRLHEFVKMINLLWSIPLQLAIAIYLLWQKLQIASLGGIFILMLMLPLDLLLLRYMKRIQVGIMKLKDKRIKLMNEILSGIKMLKLYAWEISFEQQIVTIRDKEIVGLRKRAYCRAFLTFAYSSAPFLIAIACFSIFVLVDPNNVLDANIAFVSLSLFNIMTVPLMQLPQIMIFGTVAWVSLTRINDYLSEADLDPKAVEHNPSKYAVSVENATFSWTRQDSPVLHNINVKIKPGELVAVVGTIGSGKSSFLSTLIGEMEKVQGTVNTTGTIAYVPQQAWIQNATLRQNVVFINLFQQERYNTVLEACALLPDLEVLPGGDMTEIGEKGINLSGGQKQRVSLGRALYSEADLYLLDDPLSAVDSHVEKHLFEHVIGPNGLWKNKTRILATHRITILPHVDNILVFKEGVLTEQGSYAELLNQKGAFADFLVHYFTEKIGEEEWQSSEEQQLVEEMVSKVPVELQKQISRKSEEGGEKLKSNLTTKRRGSSFSRKLSKQLSKDAPLPKKNVAELTTTETAEVGSVKLSVYCQLFKAAGYWMEALFFLGFTFSHLFNILTNLWLSDWSNDSLDPKKALDPQLRDLRLGVYGGLGAVEIMFVLLSTITLHLSIIKASRTLHHQMLTQILSSPMKFFDTTPMGRILNRFSKDVDTIDTSMVKSIRSFILELFRAAAAFIVISLENPVFLVAVIPLAIIYYPIQKLYIQTSRQLKRLQSISRSPVFTHFSETLSGVSTIRAYDACQNFSDDAHIKVDSNNACYYPSVVTTQWLSIRLSFLGYCVVLLAALLAVITRDTITPGIAGLSMSYALTIAQTLNQLVRVSSELETNIVSIERVLEYTNVETEAPREIKSCKPSSDWPRRGVIEFVNYSTRYRKGLPLILKDITCTINSAEKVGVVGRTGAGKSSLAQCLFRLIESVSGKILIDGIDISTLGLHDLRSKITIIPQDPVLFNGTMRINLDPLGNHSDSELWSFLELWNLSNFVSSLNKGLDFEIFPGGENLSVGQRQLVCLARALLCRSKILILDEATASVDMETDDWVQSIIRSEFNSCTILAIAHRLNTIMDYDRILVLDQGSLVEFDTPSNLLKNEQGVFYSMAKDAGLI